MFYCVGKAGCNPNASTWTDAQKKALEKQFKTSITNVETAYDSIWN